jgi:ketopantoate reductase
VAFDQKLYGAKIEVHKPMNPPESKKGYLEELTEFLTFLQNLWGILAGLSVFFPLSNILLRVIPLGAYGTNDGVFNQLTPNL